MRPSKSPSPIDRIRSVGACAGFLLAASLPSSALALTPIDSADLSPDITVELDSQTIADEDVAADDVMSGTITKALLGSLPPEADLAAYHAQGGGSYLLVFDVTVSLAGGVTATPRDVVLYDGVNYSIFFDGTSEGVPAGTTIDAVSQQDDGDLVLSFDTTVDLGGTIFADEDLATFDGATFSLLFDGSAAGLESGLDLDGVHVFPYVGTLAMSFDGSGQIGGVTFDDEDVLEYDPSGPTWEMAWDSSVERPEWVAGADVDAVFFVPEPGLAAGLLAGAWVLGGLARSRARS